MQKPSGINLTRGYNGVKMYGETTTQGCIRALIASRVPDHAHIPYDTNIEKVAAHYGVPTKVILALEVGFEGRDGYYDAKYYIPKKYDRYIKVGEAVAKAVGLNN
jgi:hypothetical protein